METGTLITETFCLFFFTPTWFNISGVVVSYIDLVYQVSGTLFLGLGSPCSSGRCAAPVRQSSAVGCCNQPGRESIYGRFWVAPQTEEWVSEGSAPSAGFPFFLLENKNKCFFWNWQLPPKFCFGSYFFSLLNPAGGSWDDSPCHLSEDGDQSVLNPMLSVHFSLGSDRNRNTVVYL